MPGPVKLVIITPDDPAGNLFAPPEEDFWPGQPTSLAQAAPVLFTPAWQDEVCIAPSEEDFSLFALLTLTTSAARFAQFPDEEIFIFVPPGQVEEDYWILAPTQLTQLAAQGAPLYEQDEAGFLVAEPDEDYWAQAPATLYQLSYATLPGAPDDVIIVVQPVSGGTRQSWLSPGVGRTSIGGGDA